MDSGSPEVLQDLEQAKDVVPLVVLSYTGLRTQLVHTLRIGVVDDQL